MRNHLNYNLTAKGGETMDRIDKSATLKSAEILPEEMALINEHTLKELKAEDVFVFKLILCDNEIDRDVEKFTIPALHKLAELFKGKTGIFDHNMRAHDQTARIFTTEVITDETRQTADGEAYTYIQGKAYMVRTEKNKDIIAEIEAGIKKETSVGCSISTITCSICGKNIKKEGCEHRKGGNYDGIVCCHLLSEPTDAYEWSFVAVPAQRGAGVIKSFKGAEPETSKKSVMQMLQDAFNI